MISLEDRGDSLDWARRLLRKEAAGEYVARIAVDWAREVLGVAVSKSPVASVFSRAHDRGRDVSY